MPKITQTAEGFDVPDNGASNPTDGATEIVAVNPPATVSTPPPAPDEAPPVPPGEGAEEGEAEAPLVELPTCLAKSFELLREAEALPELNKQQRAEKKKLMALIKAHCGRIQQGLPLTTIDANVAAQCAVSTDRNVTAYKLQRLARENPEVRELIKVNAALVKENAALKAAKN